MHKRTIRSAVDWSAWVKEMEDRKNHVSDVIPENFPCVVVWTELEVSDWNRGYKFSYDIVDFVDLE